LLIVLCSNFFDVFDADHFIDALNGDIDVVKALPSHLISAPKAVKQFQSWANLKYYEESIAPLWHEYKVLLLPCLLPDSVFHSLLLCLSKPLWRYAAGFSQLTVTLQSSSPFVYGM
jgi:hypothetical protein